MFTTTIVPGSKLARYTQFIGVAARLDAYAFEKKLNTCSMLRAITIKTLLVIFGILASFAVASSLTYALVVSAIMGFQGGIWGIEEVWLIAAQAFDVPIMRLWALLGFGALTISVFAVVGVVALGVIGSVTYLCINAADRFKEARNMRALKAGLVDADGEPQPEPPVLIAALKAWHGKYCLPATTPRSRIYDEIDAIDDQLVKLNSHLWDCETALDSQSAEAGTKTAELEEEIAALHTDMKALRDTKNKLRDELRFL